jgi:hypothetical protein
MTNDCWNRITITCARDQLTIKEDAAELTNLVMNELKNKSIKMKTRGQRGIIFSLWSANEPNFEWLKSLLNKYPNCWVKNEWNEEGGSAGVWIGSVKNNEHIIKELEWDDICIEGKFFLFMDEKEEKEFNEKYIN